MNNKIKAVGLILLATAGIVVAYVAGLHKAAETRTKDVASIPQAGGEDFNARLTALEQAAARYAALDPVAGHPDPSRSDSTSAMDVAGHGGAGGRLPVLDTSPQAVMQRNKQVIDAMEERFESNPEDPEWSVRTQNLINEVVLSDIPAAEGGSPSRYQALCKQAMCRISATFANEADASAWADLFLTGVSNEMPRTRLLIMQNPAGTVDVMVYGARAGHQDQVSMR